MLYIIDSFVLKNLTGMFCRTDTFSVYKIDKYVVYNRHIYCLENRQVLLREQTGMDLSIDSF